MLRRRWLRWVVELAVLAAVVVGIRAFQTRGLSEGKAPQVSVRLLDGETRQLGSASDRPMMLHFWATWCGVCKAMHGQIDELARTHDVVSVASQSGSDAEVRATLDARGSRLPTTVDPDGRLARRFGVDAYPTTFIIDGSGRIRFSEVGYVTGPGLRARLWWTSR